MNIILDIDGTLISEDLPFDTYEPTARPYLKEFLTKCFSFNGHVSIWTAATRDWYELVDKKIFRPILDEIKKDFDLVYCRDRCSENYLSRLTKPLNKLFKLKTKNYTRYNTIIIDNTVTTYAKNYGNALPISTYYTCNTDDALLRAVDILDDIFIHYYIELDIRTIDKRHMLQPKFTEQLYSKNRTVIYAEPTDTKPINTKPIKFAKVDGCSIDDDDDDDDTDDD